MSSMEQRIVSPMPEGSGAIVVHRTLSRHVPRYVVRPYSPAYEFLPLLLRNRIDHDAGIVHTVADYAHFFHRPGVPLIATLHNYVLDPFMRFYSTWLQRIHYLTDLRLWLRLSLERATVVTAVSGFTADLVYRDLGYRGSIQIIPNGVDASRFVPDKKNQPRREVRVLFAGNLSRRKGAHWLPAIAERLAPNVRLLIAAGLRSSRRKMAHPRIEWLGQVSHAEMPALFRSVDIFLTPSVREAGPLAVLEAMASGLPVVATNGSSFPEFVQEGRGGFLCPVGDVVAFADRINHLASETVMRRAMGEYNRARVEGEYREEFMVARYQTLFQQVLERAT